MRKQGRRRYWRIRHYFVYETIVLLWYIYIVISPFLCTWPLNYILNKHNSEQILCSHHSSWSQITNWDFFFRSGFWSFFEALDPFFEVCGRRVCNLTCFPLHGQILMNIQQSQPQSSFVLGPLPHSTYHTQGIFMEHHITGFKPLRFNYRTRHLSFYTTHLYD